MRRGHPWLGWGHFLEESHSQSDWTKEAGEEKEEEEKEGEENTGERDSREVTRERGLGKSISKKDQRGGLGLDIPDRWRKIGRSLQKQVTPLGRG